MIIISAKKKKKIQNSKYLVNVHVHVIKKNQFAGTCNRYN